MTNLGLAERFINKDLTNLGLTGKFDYIDLTNPGLTGEIYIQAQLEIKDDRQDQSGYPK